MGAVLNFEGSTTITGGIPTTTDATVIGGRLLFQDTIIATAAVLTLNTPVVVVTAPGAGFRNAFVGAWIFLDHAGTDYVADAGEDLAIRETDGSGKIVSATMDGTLIASAADMYFWMGPIAAPAADTVANVTNAALVADNVGGGQWATGDSPLKIRAYFIRVEEASLAAIA